MARLRFPAHDHQPAGGVIDAVTMLMPGHDALGVLKQADVIGDPEQVPERRIRARSRHGPVMSGSRGNAGRAVEEAQHFHGDWHD